MTEDDSTIRDSAERIAYSAQHNSVKRPILDNTLGFLDSTPPVAVLGDKETPQAIFFNRSEGIEVIKETSEINEPSEARGTLLLVTNERILILIGKQGNDEGISIPYGAVEEVSYRYSSLGSHLSFVKPSYIHIETIEGEYCIPIINASREDIRKGVSQIEGYSHGENGGNIERFEPDVDYNPRNAGASKKYKTILVCRKCSEEVSRGIERCPHCGFAPQEDKRGAAWKTASAGLMLTILAPLGVAMGYDSAKKSSKARKGVWVEQTVEAEESEQSMPENAKPEPAANKGSAEKLRKLKELRDDEIITEDEFKTQKEKILGEF